MSFTEDDEDDYNPHDSNMSDIDEDDWDCDVEGFHVWGKWKHGIEVWTTTKTETGELIKRYDRIYQQRFCNVCNFKEKIYEDEDEDE